MTKFEYRLIFLLIAVFLLAAAFREPSLVGDKNSFLKEFVNHEFLNFIGLIVTITLASTANVYLVLRKKEEDAGQEFLKGTKSAVRRSAFSLIWVLVLSLFLVLIKGAISPAHEVAIALLNSLAILLSLWGILVIYDITRLTLKV